MKKKNNDSGIIITVAGIVLVLILAVVFFAFKSDTKADTALLVRDDSYKSTSDMKKVVIAEFADYQCPACGTVAPSIKKIAEENKDNVTYVYRNFPLPQHTNAPIAAESAEAAGAQGKFWQMHELLYVKQSEWSESSNAAEIFANYAKDLGLNVDQFKSDVAAQEAKVKIDRDTADGNSLGVNATPTFYINGVKYLGNLDYDSIKSAVDSAVSKAK
jgi:protein-disulfide isomerase